MPPKHTPIKKKLADRPEDNDEVVRSPVLTAPINYMAALAVQKTENTGTKGPSTKLPMFDLEKDKETFNLWKARWQRHIKGHNKRLVNLTE